MPAKRKAAAPAPAKTQEAQLWDATNKMRGAVPPTDSACESADTKRHDSSIRLSATTSHPI